MKETLESVRNLHHIFILVCTAAILFSFASKSKINQYQIAKDFLSSSPNEIRTLSGTSILGEDKKAILDSSQITEIINKVDLADIKEFIVKRGIILKNPSPKKDSLLQVADAQFFLNYSSQTPPVHYIINGYAIDSLFNSHSMGLSMISSLDEFSKAWSLISRSNINEAITKLGIEADNFEKQPDAIANVSGLLVTAKYTPFAVLAIQLILPLYIFIILNHACKIADLPDIDKNMLTTFPWFGLFPDTLSSRLSKASFLLLPAVSAIQVIFTSNLYLWHNAIIALVYIILLMVIGYFIETKINFLKTNR